MSLPHPVVSAPITRAPTTATPHHAGLPFDETPDRATSLRRRARHAAPREALNAFRSLVSSCSPPASLPLSALLANCAALGATRLGREVHAFMLRRSVRCRAAETSLVGFYAKCGRFLNARDLFDGMPDKDVVSWTAMLMAYSDADDGSGAMALLSDMLYHGVVPNRHTLTVVLRSAKLEHGEQLHAHALKRGWQSDSFVGCSLVDMYARHGALDAAQLSFEHVTPKDLVCYNSLMSGYGRAGSVGVLACLFVDLVQDGFEPSESTVVALLHGCAIAGVIGPSRQFHAQVIVRGFSLDELVLGVVVDMYAKCGDLEAACRAFDKIGSTSNIVIWNAIIGGCGKHGLAEEALQMFGLMEAAAVCPDEITFTCLLSACSHAGLVEEGWHLFDAMCNVYGIRARSEHYCCMVDLLSRAGMLHEAFEFILSSERELGPSAWGALLSACRAQGNTEIAEIAVRRLFELEPGSSASYIALAGIHAANRRWGESDTIREKMDNRTVTKEAGYSCIEIDGTTAKFRAGGTAVDDRDMSEVHLTCKRLSSSMSDCYDDVYIDLLVSLQDHCV